MAADVLERILTRTRADVAERRARRSMARMRAQARDRAPARSLGAALRFEPGVSIIAECKHRSPSAGVLRDPYDPVALARAYESAGAAAISCLTDGPHFGGSLAHLTAVRGAVTLPVLRKDFIVDPYQIFEARAHDADAILLIVAALESEHLQALLAAAQEIGLECLVEVHDCEEFGIAVDAGARIIGVNNRDLRDFSVDIGRALRVGAERASLPNASEVALVAESGVESPEQILRLREAKIDAALVGTALVRSSHPRQMASSLVEAGR